MVNPWFKFYGGEYLSDPKIASLSPQERSCWVTLMALASISSTPGTIEYLTVEVLLEKSGIHFDPYSTDEWDRCISVLNKFARMKMLDKDDDGTIRIKNWEKRQETALTNAERQAKYRLRNEKVTGRVTEVTLEEKREEENISEATASQRVVISSSREDEEPRSKSKPKYPNARVAFSWFPNRQKSWEINTTELQHGELLFERGEKKVKAMLGFIDEHREEEFFVKVRKPSDLERKWLDILDYKKRNNL